MKKLFSIMSDLQTHYHFNLDFQKVDQHTGGKWLIHGTKQRLSIPLELDCNGLMYTCANWHH